MTMPVWLVNQLKMIVRLLVGVTVRTAMATSGCQYTGAKSWLLAVVTCAVQRALGCLHDTCNYMGVASPHADILRLGSAV